MAIVRVELRGVRATPEVIAFALGWLDDAGNYGVIDFFQDDITEEIQADSEHTSKAFILSVLHALGENLELNDK